MTVQEFFRLVSWEDVEEAFARMYSDEADALPALRGAYEYIRDCELKPNPEGWAVEIDSWRDDEEGRTVWDVRARKPGDERTYGLDYSLLDEWASCFVAEDVLAILPPAEAAAHILWEATWYGCTNEVIMVRRRKLEERIAECERDPEQVVPAEQV